MKKPKISIVVPVYKVEEYIDRCINSLINQTFPDIEIILVNDGSPDKCPEICDSYAEKDSRIKVIHKDNGGLSDARNVGIYEAKGDYILFVDSDDYIDLDSCDQFIKTLGSKNPDIVVGNARRIEKNEIKKMKHQFVTGQQTVTGTEYLKEELKTGTMYMAAWLNLYNRAFLLNNKLEFEVGLLHEDEEFTPRVFLKAKEVIGTDITFYNYLIREGSITTSRKKVRNAEHIIKTLRKLEKIYKDIEDIQLKSLLYNDLVNKYLNVFQVAGLHKKEYRYLIDKNFLKNKAYTRKNKMRVFLFNFNIKIYFYLNYLLKKFKK